ncbi:oxygen-independent coproporphyrinogen III oxidase [Aestuariirhabdus sp. Z084]|uniref:oxygen-independent coproporphyrinogen III oxidase n=1 Tax=Aestuariirhabdus haliotis TaxID=2918751 RepID=UPI00201B39E9|nr:oxygen-independent coproporphyrinogen III oxidase [Aestuariirhabdus haliotis]MCL6415763.1 oxygen-independent coproporphyrinogen III oxidase [Aestuariirhabdus haliotis]MCL6419680.1 oxygen-independent coproporphyrinogen III oxidase [Aestuariirhabdus haliotis]
MSSNKLVWDIELIKRYEGAGPRYTSYPTAVQFHELFSIDEYRQAARESVTKNTPLSLYFHLPFCTHVCYYCGCNKVITKDRSKALPYLELLHREIEMQAELFSTEQRVEQLHWGGGTPTFLSIEQMQALMKKTRQHFNLVDETEGDFSIEIDPREADWATMNALREMGFNRCSLGVQDLDPKVQKAVNREQSEADTMAIIDAARTLQFQSINIDLIYGLPFQSEASFMTTLERVIEIAPDRLSVFNYAHLPERFMPQRRINAEDLPSSAEKLAIMQSTTERLLDAGYVYIGMDHFARPDDELAIAQESGALHRNFQGYTTHAHCDLVGMGVSSISQVNGAYSQNHADIKMYMNRIENHQFAIKRGLVMNKDDFIRQAVISQLICHFELDFAAVEQRWDINFKNYFAAELDQLKPMAEDGLITLDEQGIEVTGRGRLLIRNICMQFDHYLGQESNKGRFSKVI